MKIVLWSKSKPKIRLLQHVLTKLDQDPIVISCKVPSNVSEQPMAQWETKQWAINRAKNALMCVQDVEVACGIEFGYEPIDDHFHCVAYACIIDRDGNQRIEHSSSYKLPRSFENALLQNKEMNDEMSQFDKIKPETNLARAIHSFMRKDDMLIQAYHSVCCAYLWDQLIFNHREFPLDE